MTDTLRLTAGAVETIRTMAAATPKHEVCGLLVDAGLAIEAHPSPNRHPNPARGFAICDAFYARLQREARARGAKIAGCFHSHPSGDTAPSQTDLLAASEDGFIWLICAPGGRMEAWRARVTAGTKSFQPVAIGGVESQSPIAASAAAL